MVYFYNYFLKLFIYFFLKPLFYVLFSLKKEPKIQGKKDGVAFCQAASAFIMQLFNPCLSLWHTKHFYLHSYATCAGGLFCYLLFCFSKKVTKKEPRNRYTARFREEAMLNSCTTVASALVTLLLELNILRNFERSKICNALFAFVCERRRILRFVVL